jgi:hypothetical protein
MSFDESHNHNIRKARILLRELIPLNDRDVFFTNYVIKFRVLKTIKKRYIKKIYKLKEFIRIALKASMNNLWTHFFVLAPSYPHSVEGFKRA